jgi:hypothetical protein
MALAPTNPDMVAIAKKAHIARMKEDGYDAFDELRLMTHYSLDELKVYYRWYCNFVNPRKAPTLFGATLPNFAETFRGKPDDENIVQLFKRFEKANGVADLLEVFAGMAIIAEAPLEDKVQFLFSIFDFAGKGDVTEDEATLAMECVCSSFVKLGLIIMPTDDELEFCSGWLFTKEDASGSKDYVSPNEFGRWARTEPASLELLETLECVPIVESILAKIEEKTAEVADQFASNRSTSHDEGDTNLTGETTPYGALESFRFKESVHVLVGPVIGKVTENSVVVLLEVNASANIGLQVAIAGGFSADDVPLAPLPPDSLGFGPRRSGQQRERLVRTVMVDMPSKVPKSVLITGLEPDTTYRLLITGVSPDDSACRTGSFRTLSAGMGGGTGLLLRTSSYSKRFHLGAYDDGLTNGGEAIGPLEEGLSLIVVSGDADTKTVTALGSKDGSSATVDTRAPPGEQCLWARLWDTAVRPGRVDIMLHTGNQVSVQLATRRGLDILRRYASTASPPLFRPELAKGEVPKLSVNEIDLKWYRSATLEELAVFEAEVLDTFRDVYREAWNLPHRREILAHCSHLMILGASDLAIDEGIYASEFGLFLAKCARIVAWEYQRQLWDDDCAAGIKESLRLQELGSYKQSQNVEEAEKREIPLHESHFHLYGHIGILFMDLQCSKATKNGSYIALDPLVIQAQWELIDTSLATEGLQCLVLCMDSPYTGRIRGSSEDTPPCTKTGIDVWSMHENEFVRLTSKLFEWGLERPGRYVQIVAGANDISATGEALMVETVQNRVLHQLTVGPISGRCINIPPEGDPRCPRYGLPASTRILSREAVDSKLKIPQIDWMGDQIWDRRNYAIVRAFCGKKRVTGINSSLAPKQNSIPHARVEITPVFSHARNQSVTLGPVIGTVTSCSAIVMVEVNASGPITCVATNVVTSQRRAVSQAVVKNRPFIFVIDDLEPESRYAVQFEGIVNTQERVGGFTTLPRDPLRLRFVAGSADNPKLQPAKPKPDIWESLWNDQLKGQWSGVDGMFRVGGQVYLRGDLVATLRCALEQHQENYELFNRYKLATAGNTGLLRVDGNESYSCVALSRGPLWNSNREPEDDIPPVHVIVQRIENLEEKIREHFRNEYRRSWNRPFVREVLAHCPQYMVFGGADLCGELVESPYAPVLMRLSKEVYCEYQRQLWDPISLAQPKAKKTGSLDKRGSFAGHEGRIHRFGATCILILDTWSNRISVDGRFCPDRPLLGKKQWQFITDSFQWNEDVQTMLVLMDMPFTGRTPAEVEEVTKLGARTWKHDEWSCREEEFSKLMKVLMTWKQSVSGREMQLITGTSFISAAGESLLRDLTSGLTIRQLTVGPLTGISHGGLPEQESSFGPNDRFVRVPMYRSFFRNYAIVNVGSDGSGQLPAMTKAPGAALPVQTSLVTEPSLATGDFDKPTRARISTWWETIIPFGSHRSWRALIVHRTQKLARWMSRTFTSNLHNSEMGSYHLSLAYRNFYLQYPKLLDSAFYDDVCDRIGRGDLQDEERTEALLEKMAEISDSLISEEDFIKQKRAYSQKVHDAIVDFHSSEYALVGTVEREKREYFYDARSRLNRLKRGIEQAAARSGYTRRKGGVVSMREELADDKDQVEQRNDRRAKRKAVYDDERLSIVKVKNYADAVVQSPPPRRRQIVHVDDLDDDGNETAFAIKELSDYDFNLKTIFKRENAIELKGGQINSVMVTEDVNATMRVVQEWFEEKLEVLDGEENDEVREHNSIIQRLTDRINFLTSINIEIKGLEEKMVHAEEDCTRCRTELDASIEVCMEKKKVLTEVKALRHVELLGFDMQLSQLSHDIDLGNLRKLDKRIKNIVEYLWSAPAVFPAAVRNILPVLGDTYMMNVVLQASLPSEMMDPMGQEDFIHLLTGILEEAVIFKAAADAPLGIDALHTSLDNMYDEDGVQLPQGWTSHYDEEKQMQYYHNRELGVTQYHKPE